MKDMSQILQQAQAMQQRMQEAQARLAETTVEGVAGGGMVRVTLAGTGEMRAVALDPGLLTPDAGQSAADGEILADLIIAAHADAKRKLDDRQQTMLRDVAGPLAGMSGMPGLGF